MIFAVPPGDAYNFVLNFVSGRSASLSSLSSDTAQKISYPLALVNGVISFGLLYLAFYEGPPVDSTLFNAGQEGTREKIAFVPNVKLIASALIFGGANIFLFIVPLIKPPPGAEPYQELPYWTHAVGGLSVFFVGWLWWLWRYRYSRTPSGILYLDISSTQSLNHFTADTRGNRLSEQAP